MEKDFSQLTLSGKNLPWVLDTAFRVMTSSDLQEQAFLIALLHPIIHSKTCVKQPPSKDQKMFFKTNYRLMQVKSILKQPLSKRPNIGFQDQLSLNVGQKYCRMLQGEHSTILLTFIKLPFVIKNLFVSIFEWPFYTGFTCMAYKLMYRPQAR